MTKIKDPGRPGGSPNKKSGFIRDRKLDIRVTEGLDETIKALVATGNYKSPSDVVHEAVQLLGLKKLSKKMEMYWINKIQ